MKKERDPAGLEAARQFIERQFAGLRRGPPKVVTTKKMKEEAFRERRRAFKARLKSD
jgi:hypothetical protein